MNYSNLAGVAAALVVLALAVLTSSKSAMVFADPHGILVVIGGTAAASLMCFPLRLYIRIAKVFKHKFLGHYSTRFEIVITEIVDLARGVRDTPDYLKTKVKSIKTHFLMDAVELINQGGISDDTLELILMKRAQTHSKRNDDDVAVFKTIAKFPPAFGLMGTTLGMISLLQQLGSPDAVKLLGPAMAVGLVATFYGIVLANLMFIPISENLSVINRADETMREIVIDGIRLIRRKEHPKVVEEHLKSYLMPAERAAFKKAKK